MSASTSTAPMASDTARVRGEQILSAKKKLKSYRAKQALMAQKRSSTSSSHSRSGSGVRSTDASSVTAVAATLSNEIVSQASTSAAPATNSSTSHARTASRSGHARGHSRAGSISITPNALFAQAQAIATSPAPTSSSVLGRPASIVAPSASHTRRHSRTHSRNFSLSRPVSISMLGAKKEEPVVLAIEHRTDDAPEQSNAQRRSHQFLDSSALFGGPATSSLRPSSASVDRFSNVSPVSPALFDRPASQSIAAPSPSAPNARHSRRLSRHARTPSVSTKRESMEIMSGLGAAGLGLDMANTPTPLQSMASSRRRSSRMSNLPSASVLFGSADPSSATSTSNTNSRMSGQQWDWRKAIADAAEEAEEGAQGRLSALDKLEGRTSPARTTQLDRPSATAESRASRRLSGHTRTESIQIPNLDEIHQNEINERRASWNAAQAFDANAGGSGSVPASAPAASSNRRESWGRSLIPPSTSSLFSAGFSSPALPSAYLSSPGRPESIIVRPESPQPEGLGTLMEEEEEEDASSPTRERQSLDMPVDGRTTAEQEARKQRREIEDEIVKRNRRASLRASLAPKPLKLKSRPPSLYLTPSQRNGLVSSPSMPNFSLSPLLPPSISDETTPKASTTALPKATEEATVGLPSRSTTCPDLSTIANAEKEAEPTVAEVESQELQDAASPEASEVTAEEKANQEQRQLEELQQQILRAHRNSVIAPVSAPTSAESNSASSGSIGSRQGIRTLRLGSQANLNSIMEAGSASNSTTSGSVAGSATTTPAQRRRSMIMGPLSAAPVGGSSSRDSDFVNAFGNTAAPTSRAARRSSIIYKPSTASVPETPSSHSASDSIVSLGGVPLSVHDELKAKANRDAALLESTKKQVEMLERKLANETERSAREKAELEQWNLDKEEHLFDRAQRAETAARRAQDASDAMRAEFEQTKEQLEDLQAEREVLQDDIEGWRSRCQDLEKTLRTEKFKSDENRKLRAAARLRIKRLTDAIEQGHRSVPADELNVLAALEQPQLDLTTILRSPNLGAVSPSLGAAAAAAALSPSLGHEDATPQITQLLAQMRQQIFNLAGSLEHERKQHVHAKEEIARLQSENQQQPLNEEQAPATMEEHSFSSADESRDGGMSNSESFSSIRRSSGLLGKNKRHVFAYDSSMGSFGQSQSSASLSMHTDETAHTDNDSDMSDSFSTKLPSSSESELVGLGMGSLQTLDEIEEVSEVSESVEGSNGTLGASVDKGAASLAWIDVEAGAVRPSLDMSESSFDATYQDAENAPPTPDLCRSNATSSRFPATNASAGEHSTQPSSSSSGDSHAAPSTPPLQVERAPSPRPEFHREWSFEWGKSRSRKLPSTQEGAEDFFGILNEDVLPPLSNSEEPLDLPPIIIQGNGILPTAKINKDGKPITSSSGMRAASIFGKRPPVARSAYLRESFDSTPTTSQPALGEAFRGHESHSSSASSLAAIGSRALSRMSLQGITGAFSGLSGYLTSQHGAASAAIGAAKMCNTTTPSALEGGLSWATQRHTFDEEEEGVFNVRKAKFDIEGGMVGKYGRGEQLSWSSGSSSSVKQQQGVAQQEGLTRRYVRKAAVPPPKATPVWLLDFTKSTQVAGAPVFTL
ncbi:hypothetical protein NDA16_001915 [Ustilago loliicola]|nr:hypothetical protein NDA16_001915 [Ustilago loliicola]